MAIKFDGSRRAPAPSSPSEPLEWSPAPPVEDADRPSHNAPSEAISVADPPAFDTGSRQDVLERDRKRRVENVAEAYRALTGEDPQPDPQYLRDQHLARIARDVHSIASYVAFAFWVGLICGVIAWLEIRNELKSNRPIPISPWSNHD